MTANRYTLKHMRSRVVWLTKTGTIQRVMISLMAENDFTDHTRFAGEQSA